MPRPVVSAGGVTVVGDSVVIGARYGLLRVLPGARFDASIGRQAGEVLDRLRTLGARHALAPVVVIHLGTNGIVVPDQMRAMLAMLGDRKRVVVVFERQIQRLDVLVGVEMKLPVGAALFVSDEPGSGCSG